MGSIVAIGVWENKGTKGLNIKLLIKVKAWHHMCNFCLVQLWFCNCPCAWQKSKWGTCEPYAHNRALDV